MIDNLRFDQWRTLSPVFEEYYRTEADELYYSILPTATMYARNAMFAGLMPSEIEKLYPEYWDDDDNEGYKNRFEEELLRETTGPPWKKRKTLFRKSIGNAAWKDKHQKA